MRTLPLLLVPLLLATSAVDASERPCAHSDTRSVPLDLAGVERVEIELRGHSIELRGTARSDGKLDLRRCADDASRLATMELQTLREGSVLRLRASEGSWLRQFWVFRQYQSMQLTAELPAALAVTLNIGSGDAAVEGIERLELQLGSGDARARGIGELNAHVGSGDLVGEDIGRFELQAVGSGDVTIRRLRGDARVGSVGSGDLVLREVGGSVEIGSVGSGDAAMHDVAGSVTVQSLGSGDVVARGIGGDLVLGNKGSGSVSHSDVRGEVRIGGRR